MDPLNLVSEYRLELNPAFQANLEPRRLGFNVGLHLEWRGLRGGISFTQDVFSAEASRSSLFFQGGYRHYLNRHHALQLEAMIGGDVTGTQPGSTLFLLSPSYVWFPSSNSVFGLNIFVRTGAELFSYPQNASERFVFEGGAGLVFPLPWEERPEAQASSVRRQPLDPQRCEEIRRLHYSPSSVSIIYLNEEAAREAEDCLNQTRRN